MKHTISILVENHAGVLSRISGLFSRRGFNIDSLAVGVTDDPSVSRVTLVADGDDYMVEQLEKQLNKLVDVIRVRTIPQEELISRELLLVKINAPAEKRSEIMTIAEITGAKVVDITTSTITLEISDRTEKLANFEALIKPYGIKEMVRTGTIALQRGADAIKR
ncbi:MAG TPA: acetolactate synthase small subunit [Oscillospiraceae bacterium]|jgi:acetolactate synthase-1/3 small subunit|nr:acetolactate synthase, small subunit [Oscillospiraceae bacterium]MDN5378259.1 acetolactate synthase small subunit [Clostridiales bacterium]HOV40205.1 acetolactate synthase small subunit [Oscillospiraceae bacterium]